MIAKQPHVSQSQSLRPLVNSASVARINLIRTVYVAAVLLLVVSMVLSVFIGSVAVSPLAWWQGLFDTASQHQAELIIHEIRLPRMCLAALVGALLASSGAAMQGLFRNPLADPSLIGVTAGASAGGSVVIVLMASVGGLALGYWLISLGAFLGGALAVLIVYRLANRPSVPGAAPETSVATMLLAGIAITALASSVTGTLEFVADNAMLRRISLWKMGGLDGADWQRVLLVAVVSVVVLMLLPRFAKRLNILLLGESQARFLGVNVEQVKRQLILLVAAAVGASVAMAGTIAFVGLVVPHIIRLLVGPNHTHLIPLSALGGAILLLNADLLARVIASPAEMPVGLITALIGAPFFIYLLTTREVRRDG